MPTGLSILTVQSGGQHTCASHHHHIQLRNNLLFMPLVNSFESFVCCSAEAIMLVKLKFIVIHPNWYFSHNRILLAIWYMKLLNLCILSDLFVYTITGSFEYCKLLWDCSCGESYTLKNNGKVLWLIDWKRFFELSNKILLEINLPPVFKKPIGEKNGLKLH